MRSRLPSFLLFSAALTGFSRVRLLGTGIADRYLAEVEDHVPAPLIDRLLAVVEDADGDLDPDQLRTVLDDPDLGPVAQTVLLMWFCGTWNALPDSWHQRNGNPGTDHSHVVSAAAYQAGLQWVITGAHPAGARQQGFGAWATAPEPVAR